MITGKDISPKRKIYYLGAVAIEILNDYPEKEIDFFDVFQKMKDKEKISINLFILTLDWLFLSGVITINNKYIRKCF